MGPFSKPGYLKTGLLVLLTIIVAFGAAISPVSAFQKKQADTVSTSGVSFTTIPTAADSLAARKKHLDSVEKTKTVIKAVAKEKPKTLWEIFIAGLLGGFTAVLLPCIYPLLPLTVSFFTKKSGSRAKGILQSLTYGLSIIVIYVSLGMLISIIFGSDALNALATNGIFNMFFFLLLVVFGISFLGAFEITLPSSLANKLDANSDKGGLTGIFFMASTLVGCIILMYRPYYRHPAGRCRLKGRPPGPGCWHARVFAGPGFAVHCLCFVSVGAEKPAKIGWMA